MKNYRILVQQAQNGWYAMATDQDEYSAGLLDAPLFKRVHSDLRTVLEGLASDIMQHADAAEKKARP